VATTAANPEEQLAWEARQRPRAAIAAVTAAVLAVAALVATTTAFSNAPHAYFVRALEAAVRPGPIGTAPSQRTAFFEYYSGHHPALIAGAAAQAIGYIALAWVLTFLAAAVRARRDEFPRFALYMGLGGAVLQAVSIVLGTIGTISAVDDFLAGPRTVEAARTITGGSLVVTSQVIQLVASLTLAAGFVLISLNAMRTGLLSRFMGVLGIIAGVLVVLPLGPFPPVVQATWLVVLGMTLFGLGRAGLPPAWRTGRAEPWPAPPPRASRRGPAQEEPAKEPAPASRPGEARRKRKRRS
jgi:hypothetical protein